MISQNLGAAPISESSHEQIVLATAIQGSVPVFEIPLTASDFYDPRNQAVFQAMLAAETEGSPPGELPPILDKLRSDTPPSGGWDVYLYEVIEKASIPLRIPYHANFVRDAAERRAATSALKTAHGRILRGDEPVRDIMARLDAEMSGQTFERDDAWKTPADALDDYLKRVDQEMQSPSAIPTGFRGIDDKLNGGFREGQFCIVGARPSGGKSSFCHNICLNVARERHVLIFSMEMTRDEYFDRMISTLSDLPLGRVIRHERRSRSENKEFNRAVMEIVKLKFTIIDTPQTPKSIEDAIRHGKRKFNTAIAFVDYLGLVSPDETKGQSNLYQATTAVSKAIKQVAMRTKIPIIAAAQLNRESAQNADKKNVDHRPKLHHLRDSGALEQDANVVILLHNENPEESYGTIEAIVDKNRNGTRGTVNFDWDGPHVRFSEQEPERVSELDTCGDDTTVADVVPWNPDGNESDEVVSDGF